MRDALRRENIISKFTAEYVIYCRSWPDNKVKEPNEKRGIAMISSSKTNTRP
jgi:hypothetical protein